jgi:phytoene dehydrogenase-like protein
MSRESFDAVIIGAGHNSLACATHLAARGWSVGVFEQAEVPGGAVKSGPYTVPGFTHDWAAMNLSLFAGSAFHDTYGAALAQRGLGFAPVANCFSTSFPDGRWLGIGTDRDENLKRIAAFSERDAATWAKLSDRFMEDAGPIFGLLGSAMKVSSLGKLALSNLSLKRVGSTLDLARFLVQSPRAWLDETFESHHVRAMLGAWGMHLDFAPDVAGGALFPYLEAMANQAFGMVLGQGGAQAVTDAMVGEITARGGAVTCGAKVVRIVKTRGSASGIELADGTVVAARKAVIANVAPSALLRLAGESGDTRYDDGLARFSHAPGTMMIHLAMDDLPDWSAGAELRQFAYVHLAPSLDQMARTYAQAKAGLLPDEPVIVVGQPTVVDPSRAPEGKHVIWLQVRMAPGTIRGDSAGQIGATDWAEAAEPFANRVLDIVDRYAPGTRGRILGQRIVTPAELEADNPNLVGGDQVCGSHHLSQHFLFRPVRGHADGTTPVKNLYHTGAAVWPGGGTGAGSGFLLARSLAGG